ncbi:hypothetical protein D3C71_2041350 [compost metagenome]
MIVGQPHRLGVQSVGDFPATVADVDAPETCHGVDVAPAVGVFQPDTFALGHHQRAIAFMLGKCGERVQKITPVQVMQIGRWSM